MAALVVFEGRNGIERCVLGPPGREQPLASGIVPPGGRVGEPRNREDDRGARSGGRSGLPGSLLSAGRPNLGGFLIIVPLKGRGRRDDRGCEVQGDDQEQKEEETHASH